MSAPVPAVEWLMSAYDATWHVFPAAQVSDQTQTFHQALCEHSVPSRHVERTAPRVFCPACSTGPTSPTTSAGRKTADPVAAPGPGKNHYGWRQP